MGNNKLTSATSSIKVLDRAISIMLAVAEQPLSLAELAEETELPRATTHRLATALETHNMLTRTHDGKWTVGSVLASIGAGSSTKLIDIASPIMARLMHTSGESVQLYQLAGTTRVCIAAQEPAAGLQNTVPVGTRLPLTAGSAAKVFLAYTPHLQEALLAEATFDAQAIALTKEHGFATSSSEREVGLASASAPVFDALGNLHSVLSVSGPAGRMGEVAQASWIPELRNAARELSAHFRN
ncbi:MAG: IclR family transcriptional regulator [Corynebacterium sp.]|nr:IclR family transcriptional regulator [Corynebacterium sp.]